MSTNTQEVWLTQEAHDRLKAELDHLSVQGRIDIAKQIEEAREEGDLKENGGYHAAKDEQAKIEARIRHLTDLLKRATVGEPEGASDVATQGSLVKILLNGSEQIFVLGSREIHVTDDIAVYSPQSPVGAATLGRKAGEETTFTAPNGKEVSVKVLEVSRYNG